MLTKRRGRSIALSIAIIALAVALAITQTVGIAVTVSLSRGVRNGHQEDNRRCSRLHFDSLIPHFFLLLADCRRVLRLAARRTIRYGVKSRLNVWGALQRALPRTE